MTKYQVKYIFSDGTEELDDELYDSEEEANEAGLYGCSCYKTGGEILHMSNPGDYDEPDESDRPDFEIIEVEM